MAKNKKKDLVQIIRDNPGCVAVIDNDCWWLRKGDPEPAGSDNWNWEEREKWEQSQELAWSGDVISLGEGYGSGSSYGGDVLQALAVIVGIKIESV